MSSFPLTDRALSQLLGAPPVPEANDDADTVAAIDALLEQSWKGQRLEPAREASDLEYLRRATLDIVGRVPALAEIDRFENDDEPNRRARLVDELLASDEYARYWSALWTDWLLVPLRPPELEIKETSGNDVWLKPAPVLPRRSWDQLRQWLQARFSEQGRGIDSIVQRLLAADSNHDPGAVSFLYFHAGETSSGAEVATCGHADMIPATRQLLRLFLGYRMEGLPNADVAADREWTAEHFWGVNAFLRQTRRHGFPEKKDDDLGLTDDPNANKPGTIEFKTADGAARTAKMRFLDGRLPDRDARTSRRDILGQMVVSHPNFAPAIVNRVWGQFFGHGLHVGPNVDDFGKHHPLRHGPLMGRLARDFQRVKYNPRRLIRWICASRAYQRSAIPADSTRVSDGEHFFSHMPLKPLNVHQLFESLHRVLSEPMAKEEQHWEVIREGMRRHWVPNDPTVKPAGIGGWDVAPALWLMQNRELNELIQKRATRLQGAAKNFDDLCSHLFLLTFARRPQRHEILKIRVDIKPVLVKEKDPNAPAEDLLWALLQSCEFTLNH